MIATVSQSQLVTLLLCSSLALPGDAGAPKPFSAMQWQALSEKVAAVSLEGAGWFFGRSAEEIQQALAVKAETAGRIVRLLERGAQVSAELERLAEHGIWVLSEDDAAYPDWLRVRMETVAPPEPEAVTPPSTVEADASAGDLIAAEGEADAAGSDLFALVWPQIERFLVEPHGEQEIARRFKLEAAQVRAWLQRAVSEEKAQLWTRPVRYSRPSPKLL